MKLEWKALRSKVARRIFTLFVSCALVPIACLAVLSYILVSKQLSEQSRRRLHQASKSVGMGIVERLQTVDSSLGIMASRISLGDEIQSEQFGENLGRFFRGLTFKLPDELDPAERKHMASDKSILSVRHFPDSGPHFFMTRAIDPGNLSQGVFTGEIDSSFLWRPETLPEMTELLVLDSSEKLLFSTFPSNESLTLEPSSTDRQWILRHGESDYIANSWSIPLKFSFLATEWKVVLGESKENVLAPMKNFETLFPLVVLMSLWLVLLFSISQIRRVLVPLEELRKATKRIAQRDFNTRVRVESGDEFEELGGSFNTMASQLDKQFTALSTMAEMDRVILATLNTREIVDTLLARIPEIVSCECVGITLPRSRKIDKVRTYLSNGGIHNDLIDHVFDLQASEVEELADHPDGAMVASKDFPVFLAPLVEKKVDSAWVLPIFFETKLSAVLTLGYRQPAAPNEEDKTQTHQLADRMAVALANARLLEELDRFSWGTLMALARTIDEKSSWTLGHCKRAAEMAVKIGQVDGLGPKDLDDLHRGGLLHDIGKIAIPPSILDKTGKLTDEEEKIMQEHPRKGARILEPIDAYKGVIPVVAQHHEWWDGTGYPYKLAGEDIDFRARIYAVADVYDALISDRPYRVALTRREVVEYVKDKAGRQFDPRVVQAFLKVMEKEKDEPIKKKLTASSLLTS